MNKLIKFLIPFIVIAILLCSCSNKKVEHTVLNMTNEDLALCSQFIWLYYDYIKVTYYMSDEESLETDNNENDLLQYEIQLVTLSDDKNEYSDLTNILSSRDYFTNLFSDGYKNYYKLLSDNIKKEIDSFSEEYKIKLNALIDNSNMSKEEYTDKIINASIDALSYFECGITNYVREIKKVPANDVFNYEKYKSYVDEFIEYLKK